MRNAIKALTLTALTATLGAASAAPLLSAQSIIVNPIETPLDVRVSVDKDPSGSRTPDYFPGERVRISTAVNEDAYVYLFNVNPDGSIDQILPNRFSGGDNFVKANTIRTFGGQGDAFALNIAEPFGVNKVLALASKTPLNLSDIAEFRGAQSGGSANTLEITVRGETNLARALSIVVTPIDQRSWTTDTVQYNVAQRQVVRQGTLSVSSNVAGAEVFIEGRRAGRAPININDLNPGTYNVRVTAPGYVDFVSSVTVRANSTTSLSASLVQVVRTFNLTIRANVSQGDVYVDGTRVGSLQNGVLSAVVDRGAAEVVVISSGYRAFVTSLNVQRDTTLTANLARLR